MESRRGTSGGRIVSWVAAAVLIAAAAIAIGWFAGEALIKVWDSQEPAEGQVISGAEGSAGVDGAVPAEADGEADGGTEAAAQEADGQADASAQGQDAALELEGPAISVSGEEVPESPFTKPQWASNLTILPLSEDGGSEGASTQAELPEEAEGQQAPIIYGQVAEPVQEASAAQEQISAAEVTSQQKDTLYKVRVGPYPSREDASVAEARLKELGFQTMLVSDKGHFVQVGAFRLWENAEEMLGKAQKSGFTAVIVN